MHGAMKLRMGPSKEEQRREEDYHVGRTVNCRVVTGHGHLQNDSYWAILRSAGVLLTS